MLLLGSSSSWVGWVFAGMNNQFRRDNRIYKNRLIALLLGTSTMTGNMNNGKNRRLSMCALSENGGNILLYETGNELA